MPGGGGCQGIDLIRALYYQLTAKLIAEHSYGGRFSLGANPNRSLSPPPFTDHKECCYCPSSENRRTWRKPTTFDRTLADSFHTSVMCLQQESSRWSVRGDNCKHYKYLPSLNNYRKPKQELRRLAIIKIGLVTLTSLITYETGGGGLQITPY
jgi:hypothetical protein